MIEWLFLLFKPKPTESEVFDKEYSAGWDHAVHIWNTSPSRIARDILSKKMGNVETAYEIGIWDFLEKRNGVK